jgi:fumarylacetoacetase
LLELSGGGKRPIAVGSRETRAFLQDGDTVTLRGWCEKSGAARIGFGAASGLILPPRPR